MPTIRAFRGLRYNAAQVGSLGNVAAPFETFYSANEHSTYAALSPFNLARLEPDPASGAMVDGQIGTLFRQWVLEGKLSFEPDPAIYVYHQEVETQFGPVTRRSFFARCALPTHGCEDSVPTLDTQLSRPAAHQRMIASCTANLHPVVALYDDPLNEIQNILEAAIVGTAGLEVRTAANSTCRIWPISDQTIISEVARRIEQVDSMPAMGQDVLQAAIAHRDALAAEQGGSLANEDPAHHVLTLLTSIYDPGVAFCPVHWTLANLEIDASELAERVENEFDCEVVGRELAELDTAWNHLQDLDSQGALAIYTPVDRTWSLLTEREALATRMQSIDERFKSRRFLGSEVIHELLMPKLLQYASAEISCAKSLDDFAEVLRSEGSLGLLAAPPSAEQILELAAAGESLLPEICQLEPSCVNGLVINPLDSN